MKFKSIEDLVKIKIPKELVKAYTEGVYADTPANRKLGRVGMSYAEYAQKAKKEGGGEEFKDKKEISINGPLTINIENGVKLNDSQKKIIANAQKVFAEHFNNNKEALNAINDKGGNIINIGKNGINVDLTSETNYSRALSSAGLDPDEFDLDKKELENKIQNYLEENWNKDKRKDKEEDKGEDKEELIDEKTVAEYLKNLGYEERGNSEVHYGRGGASKNHDFVIYNNTIDFDINGKIYGYGAKGRSTITNKKQLDNFIKKSKKEKEFSEEMQNKSKIYFDEKIKKLGFKYNEETKSWEKGDIKIRLRLSYDKVSIEARENNSNIISNHIGVSLFNNDLENNLNKGINTVLNREYVNKKLSKSFDNKKQFYGYLFELKDGSKIKYNGDGSEKGILLNGDLLNYDDNNFRKKVNNFIEEHNK